MRRRRPWLAAPSFAAALALAAAAGPLAAEMPIVFQLRDGYVSGMRVADDVAAFLGIPYAAPPVGELRFRAPRPVEPWPGPYEAIVHGPDCVQAPYPQGSFYARDESREQSEDCLYLNVWTAATAQEDRLPVLVWIHGGALTRGSGSITTYDGARLARKGVVVVTINYRLGPFGYLAHPALSADSERGVSGNYGVLDQLAALRWVRDNIASFGGDPARVTVFGESAGSWSVNSLMATPLAEGLFGGAIGQSGGLFGVMPRLRVDLPRFPPGRAWASRSPRGSGSVPR